MVEKTEPQSGDNKRLAPLNQAFNAYLVWVLAYYIKAIIKQKLIDTEIFKQPLPVLDEDEVVAFHPLWQMQDPTFDLTGVVDNMERATMGSCAVVLNTALEETFGLAHVSTSEDDLDSARAIVYMMRCAYAHTPTSPVWNIRNPLFKRVFRIKKIGLAVDFTALDGKKLEMSDHGGLKGFVSLVTYCIDQLKMHRNKT
jgi:hypothetical protein